MGVDEDVDLMELDRALTELAHVDPRKRQMVEMRFGDVEEAAEVLNISPITVKREWRAAQAWLFHELSGGAQDGTRAVEKG
jgi:DNA-directed RNA polymerase specialized sigma subunit